MNTKLTKIQKHVKHYQELEEEPQEEHYFSKLHIKYKSVLIYQNSIKIIKTL